MDDSEVLVVDQIGRTRYRTPEGFLLCDGVRIASTKPLLYRADEMSHVKSQHGMVLMDRPPEVLFSADTLASFQGKDVTDSHPSNLVGPRSYKRHTVGVVLNPRRGTGVDSNYLIADLLIKDADAIDAVEKGKVEVSCGYDQEHEEVKPGLGRFTRIVGNHVALVDKGRCGPACAIGDSEESEMTKPTMYDRLRTAFRANDEKAFDAELSEFRKTADEHAQHVIIELEGGGGKTAAGVADEANPVIDALTKLQTSMDALTARMDKFEKKGEEEKKEECKDNKDSLTEGGGDPDDLSALQNAGGISPHGAAVDPGSMEKNSEMGDSKKVANDEATLDALTLAQLRLAYQDTIAKAEILSPGLKVPVFDGLTKSKKTIADQMCGLRKAAMDGALNGKHKSAVESVIGSTAVDSLSCEQMEIAFNAASTLARMANNAPRISLDHANFRQGPMSAARLQEINSANRQPAK